jgi:hypothetical protein
MPELSKTARASLGKVVKEVHVETIEEAIKAIRSNREAKLFIGDMSRVDKLLVAYDSVSLEASLVKGLNALIQLKDVALASLGDENKRLAQHVQELEALIQAKPERPFVGEGLPDNPDHYGLDRPERDNA